MSTPTNAAERPASATGPASPASSASLAPCNSTTTTTSSSSSHDDNDDAAPALAIPADVLLSHPHLGVCILGFLDAANLRAAACVDTALRALADSDRVWTALLKASWPHLAPLLTQTARGAVGGGGGGSSGVKALYRDRHWAEGHSRGGGLDEETRLRERLAELFVEIKLVDRSRREKLASRVVPFADEAAMAQLFETGPGFTMKGGWKAAWPKEHCEDWTASLRLIDLASTRRSVLLEPDDMDWDWDGDDRTGYMHYILDADVCHPWRTTEALDEPLSMALIVTLTYKGNKRVRVTVRPAIEWNEKKLCNVGKWAVLELLLGENAARVLDGH